MNLGEVDELHDIDRVGGLGIGLDQVGRREHHVFTFGVLIAFHHVGPFHLLPGRLVDAFVADR